MKQEIYYKEEVELAMISFYNNLTERDKRHFAAISTMQLPHGGKKYISSILNTNASTIYKGKAELRNNEDLMNRVRKEGGGRKPLEETLPELNNLFLNVLSDHTAGDPMNKDIIYTDLTREEIVSKMKENKVIISKKLVSKLLKQNGYVKRKIQKKSNKKCSISK
jgi:hypothetical protein